MFLSVSGWTVWLWWSSVLSRPNDNQTCKHWTTNYFPLFLYLSVYLSMYVSDSLLCQVVFSFLFFVPVQPKQSLFEMWCLKVETREFWWDKIPLLGKGFFKVWKVPTHILGLSVGQTDNSKLSVIFLTSSRKLFVSLQFYQ